MEHWIFISSTKRFRMSDWLAVNDYVEFRQVNKLNVNDIVYLYTTAPIQRIEFKMVVDKIDVPLEESIDDSAYSLRKQPSHHYPKEKFIRLRLIKKTNAPQLHLSMLRNYGENTSMQGNHRIEGNLLEYVDSFFR